MTDDIDAKNNKHLSVITKTVKELLFLSKKTNVIIKSILYRFDRPELNNTIMHTKQVIHKTVNSLNSKNKRTITINFTHERLKSK